MNHRPRAATALVEVPASAIPRRLLSNAELADYLGVPVATVRQWVIKGTGPKRIRVGRHVRYRVADVDRWLESNVVGGSR